MKRLKTHEIIDDPDLLAEAFVKAAKENVAAYRTLQEVCVANPDLVLFNQDKADAWYCIGLQVKDTIE